MSNNTERLARLADTLEAEYQREYGEEVPTDERVHLPPRRPTLSPASWLAMTAAVAVMLFTAAAFPFVTDALGVRKLAGEVDSLRRRCPRSHVREERPRMPRRSSSLIHQSRPSPSAWIRSPAQAHTPAQPTAG